MRAVLRAMQRKQATLGQRMGMSSSSFLRAKATGLEGCTWHMDVLLEESALLK